MRIYLATSRSNVLAVKGAARLLRGRGHYVVSRWHDLLDDPTEHRLTVEQKTKIAMENHSDLVQASLTILFAHRDCRGSLVEAGLAYAMGQSLIVIGDAELTLMLNLHGVQFHPDLDSVEWLRDDH